MKVLFNSGLPFALAHGGAQIQIEQTKRALEEVGVEVEYLRWWDHQQKADILHSFERMHPTIIRMAQQKGSKVVFSELLTGLGSRGAGARFLQKNIIQIARRAFPKILTERLCWDCYQLADAAIALTSWEKHLMIEMFGADPARVQVVPNGVEEIFFADNSASLGRARNEWLVCTATITERKRVFELAEAASLAKTPLWIIGKPYAESDPYYLRFQDTVRRSDGIIRYEGGISDRAKMAGVYQSAKGFVLLSTMESQSLSALEAAAGDCPLLLSDLPWARSTFGGGATYCPVAGVEPTAQTLKKFTEGIATAPRAEMPCRWKEVGAQLKEIYAGLLKERTSR